MGVGEIPGKTKSRIFKLRFFLDWGFVVSKQVMSCLRTTRRSHTIYDLFCLGIEVSRFSP